MDGVRLGLLLAGMLNLVLIGAVACGNRGETGGADPALVERVVKLEAWRMLQERANADHREALARQLELNGSFRDFMRDARAHALSVDRTLQKQQEAMALINSLLQDLLEKVK